MASLFAPSPRLEATSTRHTRPSNPMTRHGDAAQGMPARNARIWSMLSTLAAGFAACLAAFAFRMASRARSTAGSSYSSSTASGADARCRKRLMLLMSGAASHVAGLAFFGSGGGSRSDSRGSLAPLLVSMRADGAAAGGADGAA